jgi:hypothetical protein
VTANDRARRIEQIEDWTPVNRREWLAEAAENPQVQRGFVSQPLVAELLARFEEGGAEEE